ncbi:hypothetical protein M5689_025357 [Euphorbia peplus]|nr:hypothetical protein M5689_025357 [Euphorbia peplus]
MSTMKFPRKPPLAKSPIRQRPRRVLRSSNTFSVQTPPGSLTKSQKLNSIGNHTEDSELRPEYRTISWELRALARMVSGDIGKEEVNGIGIENSKKSSPLFERGRFYEAYSARRNERLKRKIGGYSGGELEAKTPYNLGVTVDSCKKTRDSKKLGSLRKSMMSVERNVESTVPRYALRSMSKENKKPPPLGVVNYERSVGVAASEKKIGVRRGRKI